jgi:hypothetical protein
MESHDMLVCKISEAEAFLSLIQIVEMAGPGEWRLYEPCYFGAATDQEYENHIRVDMNKSSYFTLPWREFRKMLEYKSIGFDWSDFYFFKKNYDLCSVACQCIDSTIWIFYTNIEEINNFLMKKESCNIDVSVSCLFKPRYEIKPA